MQTVFTTNNAYDSILLVNDSGVVVGAWTAEPKTVQNYLREGSQPENWSPTYPDSTEISDYGTECGRNGVITDDGRRDFWIRQAQPKFLVEIVGNVRYTARILLDATSEAEAEALALHVMPSISKSTCEGDEDINDPEVNGVSLFTAADDDDEPAAIYHTIHHAARVGRETWFVISWNCRKDEYQVCVAFGPSSLHRDGYFTEKGKFKELEDAHEAFQVFVNRAQKAALNPVRAN